MLHEPCVIRRESESKTEERSKYQTPVLVSVEWQVFDMALVVALTLVMSEVNRKGVGLHFKIS